MPPWRKLLAVTSLLPSCLSLFLFLLCGESENGVSQRVSRHYLVDGHVGAANYETSAHRADRPATRRSHTSTAGGTPRPAGDRPPRARRDHPRRYSPPGRRHARLPQGPPVSARRALRRSGNRDAERSGCCSLCLLSYSPRLENGWPFHLAADLCCIRRCVEFVGINDGARSARFFADSS